MDVDGWVGGCGWVGGEWMWMGVWVDGSLCLQPPRRQLTYLIPLLLPSSFQVQLSKLHHK